MHEVPAGSDGSAIDGKDLIEEKAEQFDDLHKDVKDLGVDFFSQPPFQVGKDGFARRIGIVESCNGR